MYPILARYGPFFLYSFTVVTGLGLAAGIGLAGWQARRQKLEHWLDGVLLALLVALVAGRIPFVASKWEYFQENPAEMWQPWRGGLSYHGALLGGLLATWFWWLWRQRGHARFAAYAAPLALGLALASVFGWLACWLEACAYGRETILGIFSGPLPDEYGVEAVRFRSQLLGLLLALLALAIVMSWLRRRSPAMIFWLTMLLLAIGRLLVSLWRGDPWPTLGGWRLDTVLEAIVAIISFVLLQYEAARARGDGTTR